MFNYGKQGKNTVHAWIGCLKVRCLYPHSPRLPSSPKGVQAGSYLYCTTFSPQTLMEGFLAL